MQPCLANIFEFELAEPGKFANHRIERPALIPLAANIIAAKIFGNVYFTRSIHTPERRF